MLKDRLEIFNPQKHKHILPVFWFTPSLQIRYGIAKLESRELFEKIAPGLLD